MSMRVCQYEGGAVEGLERREEEGERQRRWKHSDENQARETYAIILGGAGRYDNLKQVKGGNERESGTKGRPVSQSTRRAQKREQRRTSIEGSLTTTKTCSMNSSVGCSGSALYLLV